MCDPSSSTAVYQALVFSKTFADDAAHELVMQGASTPSPSTCCERRYIDA